MKEKIQWDFGSQGFENDLNEICSSFLENDFSKYKA